MAATGHGLGAGVDRAAVLRDQAVGRPVAHVERRRLVALDVLRGATVALMILVENQGNGRHAFPGLAHARWDGLGVADVVFPLFLFVVGASMAFTVHECPWPRIVRRAATLYVLGVVVTELRWLGVLQRIALCYLLAAVVVRFLSRRQQLVVGATVLWAWWLFLVAHPMTPESYGDPWLFNASGLASTPAATVNVLAGYWVIGWLREHGAAFVARLGADCVGVGVLWALVHPLNKRLWTGSFVLLTVGLSALALVALVHAGDRPRLTRAFETFGRNAVVLYVASELVSNVANDLGARDWLYRHLFVPWGGLHVGSLAYALAFVVLWWLVAYALWRRRWFVSV